MRVTLQVQDALTTLERALELAKTRLATAREALVVAKAEYIERQVEKAWFNKKPSHWDYMWENGGPDDICGRKWQNDAFWEVNRAEDRVARLAILLTRTRNLEPTITEVTFEDSEIGLLNQFMGF